MKYYFIHHILHTIHEGEKIWMNTPKIVRWLKFSLAINMILLLMLAIISYQAGLPYVISKLTFGRVSAARYATAYPYYTDRKTLFEKLSGSQGSIVFLGDSITDGCEWNELLNDRRIVNRGIHSDTTKGVLKRLDCVINRKPAEIFVMIGTNDLQHGEPVREIEKNYRIMLERIREKLPDIPIVVQSVLPVNYDIISPENKRNNSDIMELNQKLEQLAKKFNARYTDVYSKLADSRQQLARRYTTDGLHLNGEGYDAWKEVIAPYIKK